MADIFQTEINDGKHFSSINQVFIEYDESKMIKVMCICYSCLLFAQESDSLWQEKKKNWCIFEENIGLFDYIFNHLVILLRPLI